MKAKVITLPKEDDKYLTSISNWLLLLSPAFLYALYLVFFY